MTKVETYYVSGWEDAESGLLISENDKWILVKHIPVDYVIDGFRLYKKEFVVKRERTAKEEQIEKVLKLKKVSVEQPRDFQFSDTAGLLEWCENKYGLFEFQDDDETDLHYGKVNDIQDDYLKIDLIKEDGSIEFDYDYEYSMAEIRVITFETDYFTSLKLLMEDKMNKA